MSANELLPAFVRRVPYLLPAMLSLTACSQPVNEIQSPPTPGTYSVTFQSLGQAVASENVTISVFDDSDGGVSCSDLISKQASHQDLPPTLTQTPSTPTCNLQCAAPPCPAGTLTVPYGNVAVLAVAQAKGIDFARGCAVAQITQGSPNVTVNLFAAPGVAVPPTNCPSFSAHCKGTCQ